MTEQPLSDHDRIGRLEEELQALRHQEEASTGSDRFAINRSRREMNQRFDQQAEQIRELDATATAIEQKVDSHREETSAAFAAVGRDVAGINDRIGRLEERFAGMETLLRRALGDPGAE